MRTLISSRLIAVGRPRFPDIHSSSQSPTVVFELRDWPVEYRRRTSSSSGSGAFLSLLTVSSRSPMATCPSASSPSGRASRARTWSSASCASFAVPYPERENDRRVPSPRAGSSCLTAYTPCRRLDSCGHALPSALPSASRQ
ncbi:hypothetical protein AB0890_12715 [Streptomyces sp. NPDC005406]|uniref:hypothetical protein n=1 Tax=Streptomyces sp. NPDC005406 TaxID=3155339 RepID=UPI0034527A58